MRSPDQIGISWEENQLLMQQLREKAALENRRQHNIFEVGDLIVYLSNIAPEHNDIYNVWKVDLIGCLVMLGDMDYRAMYGQIRHASPEEITAGHRL